MGSAEAHRAILNGPDTPGRRWLLEQLKKRRQETAELERNNPKAELKWTLPVDGAEEADLF